MTAPVKQTPAVPPEEEELAILFPQPVPFSFGQGKFSISLMPMDTASCARFAAKARPIVKAALSSPTEFLGAVIVAALDYPDEALSALAIATGKTEAYLGKLPPAVTSELIKRVFEVNREFFDQSAALPGSGAQAIAPGADRVGVGPTH